MKRTKTTSRFKSFGKKKAYGGPKSGSGGGNRNRGRGRGRGRGRKRGSTLDVNMLIQKEQEVKAQKPYECQNSFADLPLSSQLLRRIEHKGYTDPTEIQDKAILDVLNGRDVIGLAGTGTGKTAAFTIPIIQRLLDDEKNNRALVIAPTRELATQITEEFKSLTKDLRLWSTTLIGGSSVGMNIKALRRTNHMIIGTPGRLLDMAKRGFLKMEEFSTFVLDEFDQMLDMGFLEDIQALEAQLVNKSQTLLFSATLNKGQEQLVAKMTSDPVRIKAGVGTHLTRAIEQEIVRVGKGKNKIDILHDLLEQNADEKVLLFCETKREVDSIHTKLKRSNILVDQIHGDKTQKSREVALSKFKRGKVNVLVATDVMARGIDVDDISLVINYQIPRTYDSYVHRIGRTGRAGRKGKAVTLVDGQ